MLPMMLLKKKLKKVERGLREVTIQSSKASHPHCAQLYTAPADSLAA